MKKVGVILFFSIFLLVPVVFAQDVRISEVDYSTKSDDLESEFIELYIGEDNFDLAGWTISTFDGDDEFLPFIFDLGEFDYVAIHPGGNPIDSDLDASDGTAIIYLGRDSEMLDDLGDEVVLYNADDEVVDFMRYGGGNSGIVKGDWGVGDPGPSEEITSESVQIHGDDFDSSENWISASSSRGNPNHFEWIIDNSINLEYQIHNGLNREVFVDNLTMPLIDITVQVHNRSGPINLSDILNITVMINSTYNFLRERGFNQTPEMGDDGDLDIVVSFGATTSGFCNATNNGTYVHVTLVPFRNINDSIRNKLVLEHEQTHAFQYNQSGSAWGPYSDWADIEGHAEYWSHEITADNFNVTFDQIFGIDPASTAFITNWLSNTDRSRNPFTDFTTSNYDYGAGHLLYRYIADVYNESKVVHTHLVRNVSAGITGVKIIEKAFEEQGHNMTFAQIFIGYMEWLWKNWGDRISLTSNETYGGRKVTESGSLRDWGTDYERIGLNFSSTGPYIINFTGEAGQNFSITIILDGRVIHNNFTGSSLITFDQNNPFDEIILVKSKINGDPFSSYSVTLKHQNVTNSSISNSSVEGSRISGSTMTGSTVTGSSVEDSTVHRSTVTDTEVIDSTVEDSAVSDTTIRNSIVNASTVSNSNITNSVIHKGVNIKDSTVRNAVVRDSIINNASINGGSLEGTLITSSTSINSDFVNSFVVSSEVTNSLVIDSDLIGCVATDAIIINGTVIEGKLLCGKEELFVRGDVNSDGLYNIADAIYLISSLFIPSAPQPLCDDAADANDDGMINIADGIYILNSLFVSGSPPPPQPYPEIGIDPTDDDLDCESYPPAPFTGPLPAESPPEPSGGELEELSEVLEFVSERDSDTIREIVGIGEEEIEEEEPEKETRSLFGRS